MTDYERGFADGIERAAKVCDILKLGEGMPITGCAAGAARCARAIRAISPPAQQPAGADALLIRRLQARLSDAEDVINRGIALMTDYQVGQWTGVRAWLETPLEMYGADALDAKRYREVRRDPAMLLHLRNSEFDAALDARMGEKGAK